MYFSWVFVKSRVLMGEEFVWLFGGCWFGGDGICDVRLMVDFDFLVFSRVRVVLFVIFNNLFFEGLLFLMGLLVVI